LIRHSSEVKVGDNRMWRIGGMPVVGLQESLSAISNTGEQA